MTLSSCIFLPNYFDDNQGFAHKKSQGFTLFEKANYKEALPYLAKDAERGDRDAQYMVALIHFYGLAGEKNGYLAQKWFTLAANQGHKPAQVQLAFLYKDEMSPLYNPLNAYHWFSLIVDDYPEYENHLRNLEVFLYRRGVLSEAKKMPRPYTDSYSGADFNSLFLLR